MLGTCWLLFLKKKKKLQKLAHICITKTKGKENAQIYISDNLWHLWIFLFYSLNVNYSR